MTTSATLGNAPADLWVQSTHGQMFVRSWFPDAGALRPNCAPILLLHESLGCIEQWKDFPAALAQATGRTVVAYDRLGFGRSDRLTAPPAPTFVEDEAAHGFAQVLDHLGIERFVVVGHSVGGSMAVHCAAQYPAACQAMITMSAVTFVEPRTLEGIRQARSWFAAPAQRERLRRYHGERSDWVLSAASAATGYSARGSTPGSRPTSPPGPSPTPCLKSAARHWPSMATTTNSAPNATRN